MLVVAHYVGLHAVQTVSDLCSSEVADTPIDDREMLIDKTNSCTLMAYLNSTW
jgi:hypothetical protein